MRHYGKRRSEGFSLVELAIVLGIVAVVMSGIWEVARRSRDASRTEQASEQLVLLLRNIRGFYTSQATVPTGSLFGPLSSVNAIPREMIRRGTVLLDHPWGGERPDNTALAVGGVTIAGDAAGVCASGTAGQGFCFTIAYRGLTPGACVTFLGRAARGAAAEGLVDLTMDSPATGVVANPNTDDFIALCGGPAGGSDFTLRYRVRLAP